MNSVGCVGGELHPDVNLPGRERLGRLLAVNEDAHHRVGVGELAAVDPE